MSKRSKPPAKYRGLSFPVPLLEEIKLHISNKPEYRSVSEFIRESIREKMSESNVTSQNMEYKINDELFNTYQKNSISFIKNINNKIDDIYTDIDCIYKFIIKIDEHLEKIESK